MAAKEQLFAFCPSKAAVLVMVRASGVTRTPLALCLLVDETQALGGGV